MADFHFNPKIVSREFRDFVGETIPALGKHKPYWLLLQHLLFGRWYDKQTGYLLIPAGVLAAIEGLDQADSNYCGYRFLDEFSEQVLPLKIAQSRWGHGPADKCRAIVSSEIPEVVLQAAAKELKKRSADQVWMGSGRKYLPRDAKAARLEEVKLIEATFDIAPSEQTKSLLTYMNSVSANRFTAVVNRHMQAAKDHAATLKDADNQLRILQSIEAQPVPVYSASPKTVRVFSSNESILSLHRSLRKILCQDWISADLKSAQLAIVAKLWDIPSINTYLTACKGSIWKTIADECSIPYTEDTKAAIKKATYSIIFGMGSKKHRELCAEELSEEQYEAFLGQPMIVDLLKARRQQIRLIHSAKGARDAFGQWLELRHRAEPGFKFQLDNSRSIMACVAQSWELRLLMPCLQKAIDTQGERSGLCLLTWLHDGFCFVPARDDQREYWTGILANAVKEQAIAAGMLTELEFTSGLGD